MFSLCVFIIWFNVCYAILYMTFLRLIIFIYSCNKYFLKKSKKRIINNFYYSMMNNIQVCCFYKIYNFLKFLMIQAKMNKFIKKRMQFCKLTENSIRIFSTTNWSVDIQNLATNIWRSNLCNASFYITFNLGLLIKC